LIEQGLTYPPTQYRLSGRDLQVKRPNQQYQSTKGKDTTKNPENANNTQYSNTINRDTANPLVYTLILWDD